MAKQTPYRYSADAKEIIRNVHNFCKQEKEEGLKISLNQAKERTSTMTGVSKSTIERLMKRDRTKKEKPELPRTKRVQLDEFDLGGLSTPCIRKGESYHHSVTFKQQCRKTSKSILRKYMRQLGFTYRKSQTNRKLLMERGDVVLSRILYLRKIRQLREAGCNIVTTDETNVHSNHTVSKTWQDGDVGANVPFFTYTLFCSVDLYLKKAKYFDFKIKLLCLFR